MFAVVEFVKEKTVQVLPKKWLKDKTCLWPDKPTTNLSSLIRNLKDAGNDWTRHPVDILRKSVDYRKGLKVSKKAENQTSVETTDNDAPAKRRKNKEKAIQDIWSSSSNESSSGSESDLSEDQKYQVPSAGNGNGEITSDSTLVSEIPLNTDSHSLGLVNIPLVSSSVGSYWSTGMNNISYNPNRQTLSNKIQQNYHPTATHPQFYNQSASSHHSYLTGATAVRLENIDSENSGLFQNLKETVLPNQNQLPFIQQNHRSQYVQGYDNLTFSNEPTAPGYPLRQGSDPQNYQDQPNLSTPDFRCREPNQFLPKDTPFVPTFTTAGSNPTQPTKGHTNPMFVAFTGK